MIHSNLNVYNHHQSKEDNPKEEVAKNQVHPLKRRLFRRSSVSFYDNGEVKESRFHSKRVRNSLDAYMYKESVGDATPIYEAPQVGEEENDKQARRHWFYQGRMIRNVLNAFFRHSNDNDSTDTISSTRSSRTSWEKESLKDARSFLAHMP